MIKPLLRTMPSLSGNAKIACTLLDYNTTDNITFDTNIRGAKLYPISSILYQRPIEISLLNSKYDTDIAKFYGNYADNFFNSCFNYDKLDIPFVDKTEDISVRNTDFEFGANRISYEKSNNQICFYAPIYIDKVKDIPGYFLIHVELQSDKYFTEKYIRVNIGTDKDSDKYNYIYSYIANYVSTIDDDVAYMDGNSKSVTYYGINLAKGGFTKKTDTTVSALYNIQMPLQMFDNMLCSGFSRNLMAMKQILPLSYCFSIDDILDSIEKVKFNFAKVKLSGAYYDDNGNRLPVYDFNWDYDNYTEKILVMNPNNGSLSYYNGYAGNMMDVSFPSFKDKYISSYQFANKLSITFGRWKMKYSEDDYPYIANMSWVFSNNQNSNYRYKEFPTSYLLQAGYAYINDDNMYNLKFPVWDDKIKYDEINIRSAKKYKSIMDNYCLSWFDVTKDTKEDYIINNTKWKDTNKGYVYFNGILYNLNNVYDKVENYTNEQAIDKFAVLVYPNVKNVMDETYIKENIKFVSNVIINNNGKNVSNNCTIKLDSNNLFDIDTKEDKNRIIFDQQFEKYEDAKDIIDDNNIYVNAKDIGNNYYDKNILYRCDDVDFLYKLSDWATYLNDNKNIPARRLYDLRLNKLKDLLKSLAIQYENKVDILEALSILVYSTIPTEITTSNIFTYIPELFSSTAGYELSEKLPIYMSNQIFDKDGNIDIRLKNLYINLNPRMFDPIKLSEFIDEKTSKIVLQNYNRETIYNNMLYQKNRFIDLDYFEGIDTDLSCNIFTNYIMDNGDGIYNIYDYKNENTDTGKMYKVIVNLYKEIIDKSKNLLKTKSASLQTYNYIPVLTYANKEIAYKIVEKSKVNFPTFSEDEIKITDNNVLYIHPCNFELILKKINKGWKDYQDKKCELYGKVLDIKHYKYLKSIFNLQEDSGIFYKQYKIFYIDNKGNVNVKYHYRLIDDIEDKHLEYDVIKNMFFNYNSSGGKTYFNVVQHAKYIKIDKYIWDFICLHGDDYKDLFIYRPLTDIEYDEKYGKDCKMGIKVNLASDKNNIYTNTDNMLYPCFNTHYVQDKQDTVIYKNYCVNNITEAKIIGTNNNFYKYNCSNAILFINITKKELENYKLKNNKLIVYKKLFDDNKIKFTTNDSNFAPYNINIIEKDGIRYGYYLLEVDVNNTLNMFNIRGLLDKDENSNFTAYVDQIPLLKYITIINGIDVTKNNGYIQDVFKQLCPFLYINLLNMFSLSITIVAPKPYSLTNNYISVKDDTKDNIKEYDLKYLKQTITSAKKQVLQRYATAITPHIKETHIINNQYNLKLKNVKQSIIPTGKYNSIGDTVIYSNNIVDINKATNYNIYAKDCNNIVDTYLPIEYKHYNDSNIINTQPEFICVSEKPTYTYKELIDAESEEQTYKIFKDYILENNLSLKENEILFLFNKYNCKYLTNFTMLDINRENKKYKLQYKFILK